MKTINLRIRNAAFYAQLATFAAMAAFFLGVFRVPGISHAQNYDLLSIVFGTLGLPVLLLTLMVKESGLQKLFFMVAGAAGAGVIITLGVFALLSWSGHTPGGDGGEITVPTLIIVCPILFIIGAVGGMVFLIKEGIAGRKNKA